MSFRVPKYRLHKGSGQALVQVGGRRIYLGKFGSAKNEEKYRRAIVKVLAKGDGSIPSPAHSALGDLSVKAVISEAASTSARPSRSSRCPMSTSPRCSPRSTWWFWP